MPNDSVDKNSWESSACYPRRTFYPLSDGPSIRNHRITMADFRPCSTCQSYSQAGLCHYTLNLISNQAEPTFARLRYFLGGSRPRQTTNHTLSLWDYQSLSYKKLKEWYFKIASIITGVITSKAPTYPTHLNFRNNVKL